MIMAFGKRQSTLWKFDMQHVQLAKHEVTQILMALYPLKYVTVHFILPSVSVLILASIFKCGLK